MTKGRRERRTDAWFRMRQQARELDDKELRRHASVSTDNNHQCVQCFCCAAQAVLEERRRARGKR